MGKVNFSRLSSISPDVVVVGLGPVGITLCNILGSLGVEVLGIDAKEDIYPLPRAIGMDHEVMRIFQNIGIADDLAGVIVGLSCGRRFIAASVRLSATAAQTGLARISDFRAAEIGKSAA